MSVFLNILGIVASVASLVGFIHALIQGKNWRAGFFAIFLVTSGLLVFLYLWNGNWQDFAHVEGSPTYTYPLDPVQVPPQVVQPKRFHPKWNAAVEQSAGDFKVDMAPCISSAANLRCFFRITNESEEQVKVALNDKGFYQDLRLAAVDDQGKMYFTQLVEIAGLSGQPVTPVLPPGVPIQGSATFGGFTGGASLSLIQFGIRIDPSRPKPPSVDRRNHIVINIRNVPVENQEPQ